MSRNKADTSFRSEGIRFLTASMQGWHHGCTTWAGAQGPGCEDAEHLVWRFAITSSTFLVVFFFCPCIFFLICSEFCHTLEWNSHGFTCVPHPDPPSHLPLPPLPLGFPSAPGPRACLMHPTWAGDLFHPRYYTCFNAVLLKHPTLSFSHRV